MLPQVDNDGYDLATPPRSRDLDVLLKDGIAAAQNGERELARQLLSEAADVDPQSEDAWMWLASVSDYPEELLAFLNRVLAINPENERAAQWRSATRSLMAKTFVQRAVAARDEGSVKRARQCLDQAINYDYNCEMAWFWRASFAETEDEKLECLRNVLEINPANEAARHALDALTSPAPSVDFNEAKSAAAAGKRKKALELVEEFLRSVPDNVEAWVLRSHLSLSIDEKIESLEKALAIEPEHAAAKSNHAFLLKTVGRNKARPASVSHVAVIEPAVPDTTVPTEASVNGSFTQPFPEADDSMDPDLPTLELATPLEDKMVEELPADDISQADLPDPSNLDRPYAAAEEDDLLDLCGIARGSCSYCGAANEVQAFECTSCRATLTLSDIESLLSNPRVDRERIQQAVTQMEAEWNLREFGVDELVALGIGYFNLNNYGPGLRYLQEASRVDPNNVILAGQVNALAIRLAEMRRQVENNEARPFGKTILVVDDSPTVRKLIAGKLEKSGHTVQCAVDGVEAIEMLHGSLPDLVLLDITMPRMDGYDVCKEIRQNPAAANLPVVMISGKDGFFDKVRGRMAGATGYVTKPFGPETLMKALEVYLLPERE